MTSTKEAHPAAERATSTAAASESLKVASSSSSSQQLHQRPIVSESELKGIQMPGTNRKRRRGEPKEEEPTLPPHHAPVITDDGMVEFSLAAIHKHLICGLCQGYYKDPYTITDCLHTFCKSCLFYAVACGCHECPKCRVYLGSDPLKVAVLDRSLQDLVDRVVFPEFLEAEQKHAEDFYAARRMAMKAEFSTKEGQHHQHHHGTMTSRSQSATLTSSHPDPSSKVRNSRRASLEQDGRFLFLSLSHNLSSVPLLFRNRTNWN
jgi:hypothetical protein